MTLNGIETLLELHRMKQILQEENRPELLDLVDKLIKLSELKKARCEAQDPEKVHRVRSTIGCSVYDAREALFLCGGDAEWAIELLLRKGLAY